MGPTRERLENSAGLPASLRFEGRLIDELPHQPMFLHLQQEGL
jgi:hypothetical protein